jgi:dATP pyrophosphohydrolase
MNVRYDMIALYVVRPDAAGKLGEFLQLRRSAGEYMGGAWSIVRGKIEAGETAWQAALRELREETGLVPRELYKLTLMEIFYLVVDETIWHVPAFCAVVDRDSAVTLNDEHDQFRWITRDQAPTQMMWANERQLVDEVCFEIFDNGPAKPYLRVQFV